ncbi:agamous-like MADS-box protein AGL65 [Musa acuminata AAA Group]|uniref:agamous-like MADS-box protein AGL65 n=1 Tax=Musa acuminata AAA Group TaxID=214697 RepID=UPI0031D18C2B
MLKFSLAFKCVSLKLESLEVLKKTFKKLDHDVDIQEFLGSSTQTVEEITNHWSSLHGQLLDVQKRLSNWADPDKIDNINHITTMEQSLKESLGQIQVHKENFGKQLISVDYSGQNDIHPSTGLGCEQGASPVSWLHINDDQQLMLPQDANLLPWSNIREKSWLMAGVFSKYKLNPLLRTISRQLAIRNGTIEYWYDRCVFL